LVNHIGNFKECEAHFSDCLKPECH